MRAARRIFQLIFGNQRTKVRTSCWGTDSSKHRTNTEPVPEQRNVRFVATNVLLDYGMLSLWLSHWAFNRWVANPKDDDHVRTHALEFSMLCSTWRVWFLRKMHHVLVPPTHLVRLGCYAVEWPGFVSQTPQRNRTTSLYMYGWNSEVFRVERIPTSCGSAWNFPEPHACVNCIPIRFHIVFFCSVCVFGKQSTFDHN